MNPILQDNSSQSAFFSITDSATSNSTSPDPVLASSEIDNTNNSVSVEEITIKSNSAVQESSDSKETRRTPQSSDRKAKSPSSRSSRSSAMGKTSSNSKESSSKDVKSPTQLNSSTTSGKVESTFLQLPLWRPDDATDNCMNCGAGFNALLLRFKHHCRACGDIFCGNCTRMSTLPLYGILNEEVRVCPKCFEKEMDRRKKDQAKKDKQEQRRLDDQRLKDLFDQLAKAFADNDEELAISLKAEIDVLRDVIYKREQRRQEAKQAKIAQALKAKAAKDEERAKEKEQSKKKREKGSNRSKVATGDSRASKPLLSPFGDAANSSNSGSSGATSSHTKKLEAFIMNSSAISVMGGTAAASPSGVGADGSLSIKVNSEPDSLDQIQSKLEEKIKLPFQKLLNPPTPGKSCLVLDVDYTLFDHLWHLQVKEEFKKDKSQIIPEFQRPYLHQFLQTCYEVYDLVIWSATGFVAIDSKLTNLGIYENPNYKITLVLSKEHMITVKHRKKKGGVYEETVKPLEVLWRNFPGVWTPANTIHIDDLAPNFQLNPKNGLAITPYKDASKLRDDDLELMYLTKYLLLISKEEKDFASLNHKLWKEYIISKLWQKQTDYTIPERENRLPFDRNLLADKSGSKKQLATFSAPTGTPAPFAPGLFTTDGQKVFLPPVPTEPAPFAPSDNSITLLTPLNASMAPETLTTAIIDTNDVFVNDGNTSRSPEMTPELQPLETATRDASSARSDFCNSESLDSAL